MRWFLRRIFLLDNFVVLYVILNLIQDYCTSFRFHLMRDLHETEKQNNTI